MDILRSKKQNLPAWFFDTLRHLFIPDNDTPITYWMLGAITCIGMVMRLWKIDEPVAYDEAYTFIYFATREFKHILADYSAPNNHILHTLLVRISYELLGERTWIVRLPAFLAGTLCIPAAYFAARRIFNDRQSLAAAALVALTPWLISYSTNGRGYTLLTLLALLLANLAALLLHRQSRTALAAYGITAALGFYTIPIFLYPMAGISLWVLVTLLTTDDPRKAKWERVGPFLLTCALAGMLTLLVYSPVILFGTGLDSIIRNEIVESRQWAVFVENLRPRAVNTWESWMLNIGPPFQYLLLGGFLISVLFYRQASSQRWPLQVFLVLGIAIVLVLQRVAPLARIWLYLEAFYMIFAGAGLVWLAERLLVFFGKADHAYKLIPAMTVLAAFLVFAIRSAGADSANRRDFPEQQAAEYLASRLQPGDRILSLAPVDIQTAYYLYMNGIPYEVFYQRDHPEKFQNGIVVLRTSSRYNTPESVLDFYGITPDFNLEAARLIYEYGQLNVFSIPAK